VRAAAASFGVILTPSPEFCELVKTELAKLPVETSVNVRDVVKRIWTWPSKGYADFIAADSKMTSSVNEHLGSKLESKVSFAVENGHYLRLQLPGINKILFDAARPFISGILQTGLCLNNETDHISLVPSDVLAKLDKVKWMDFYDKHCREPVTDLLFDHCVHTFSFDWARFGVCVVARLKSATLDKFMGEFNREFSLALKPKFHITFAIQPRLSIDTRQGSDNLSGCR